MRPNPLNVEFQKRQYLQLSKLQTKKEIYILQKVPFSMITESPLKILKATEGK